MNNIVMPADPMMSSREIAELVESRHDNVKVAIERLAARRAIAFPAAQEKATGGRPVVEYLVGKRDSYVIVAQLSPEFTARLVDRWQELEQRVTQQPVMNLNDPAFLRGALLEYTERVLHLEATVAEQAPAVEFAKAVRNTSDTISISQMAAVLGIGRNRFYARLRADHILMADNLPYQIYKDRGLFRVIESVWIDEAKEPRPTFKTVVTGRGQVFLQRKYGAEVTA